MFKNLSRLGKPEVIPPACATQAQLTTTAANIRAEIDLLSQEVTTLRQEVAILTRAHEERHQVEATPAPVKRPARRAKKVTEVK